MFKRRFWVRAVLALIAVVFLVGGGMGLFRVGWWQGYMMGRAASGEEGDGIVPRGRLPHDPRYVLHVSRGFGYGPFGFRVGYRHFGLGAGLVLGIGSLLVLLVVIGGILRFFSRRAACVPGGEGWIGHHHPHHPGHPHPADHPHHSFEGKVKPGEEPQGQASDDTESE